MYFIESSADIIIKQQDAFSGCSEDYLRNTLQIKGQILVRFVILKLSCTPTCTESKSLESLLLQRHKQHKGGLFKNLTVV